jgi:hypothetical protein
VTTTDIRAPTPRRSAPEHPATAPSRGPQFKLWAPIGAVVLAVIVVGWTRWLLGPDSTPSPVGPDPIETWRLAVVRCAEVASSTAAPTS